MAVKAVMAVMAVMAISDFSDPSMLFCRLVLSCLGCGEVA
jgi:hypothetical protein